jgi:hypothetical protein
MPLMSNLDSKLVMELMEGAYLRIKGPKINVHMNHKILKVAKIYLQLTKKTKLLGNCGFKLPILDNILV